MANSLQSVQERQINTKGVVAKITNDKGVAIRLSFVSNGSLSITSVTTTAATDITIVWSDATTTIYDFATYATIGELADKINSDGYFEAKVLDALRADATADQFVDGVISLSYQYGVPFYDVLVDSSAALYWAYRISADRLKLKGKENVAEKHRTHLLEIVYLANVSAASADSVQVWDITPDGKFETQLLSEVTVDNTKTTIKFNDYDNKLSCLDDGHELLVKVKDGTSLANGGYLLVTGEIE